MILEKTDTNPRGVCELRHNSTLPGYPTGNGSHHFK